MCIRDRLADSLLASTDVPGWGLPRADGRDVPGIAYEGRLTTLSGEDLGREIVVLGYNHNLQSSFGVTRAVMKSISCWIKSRTEEALCATR